MSTRKATRNSEYTINLLLAEHKRISGLYEANSQMGDKYVTTYLTTMSLIIALLVGISKFSTPSKEALSIELALVVVLVAIGFSIFRRLVARRIRMIEYLRAVNRINRYFAEMDDEVEKHLYWRANDTEPSMYVEGTFLGGLRDIVALLNSFSIGISTYLMIYLIDPFVSLEKVIAISFSLTAFTLISLELYGRLLLNQAAKRLENNSLYPTISIE